MVDLEIRSSTRDGDEHARVRDRRSWFAWLPPADEIGSRADEVQALPAAKGQDRAAAVPDLLIAATVERHRVSVLRHGADFDTVAAVTGQPTTWVVGAGTAGRAGSRRPRRRPTGPARAADAGARCEGERCRATERSP